ncbi:MAG: O-antigen ligase family protein [Elusimicrobia bacterium]|nr:O-antigen ligase family protein [Elusimicrobiota bacterium]
MTSSEGAARTHPVVLTGLCLAIGLAPFAWSTHFVAEYTLPKLLALHVGLVLAAGAAAWSASTAWRCPLDLPVLVNLAVLALLTATSQDPWLSLVGRYNSYSHGLWVCAIYAGLGLLAARLDRGSVRAAVASTLLGGSVVAAYGVLQTLGYEWFLRAALPQGRAVSSIGSPVDLGAYLATLFPLAVAWTVGRSSPAGALATLALAAGLWATASRGPWLASVLGVGAFAFVMLGGAEPGKAKDAVRRVPAWAWAAVVLVLAAGGWLAVRRAAARGVTKTTDSARVEVWRSAWQIFELRPVFGTGPDTFEQAFRRRRTEEFVRRMGGSVRFQAYAHNDLLQALSTTGLLGAGVYVWLLVAVAFAALHACRRPEERWLAGGIFGGLAAAFVVVKFNPIALEVMALVSFLAGLGAALNRPDGAPGAGRERLERLAAACLLAFCGAGLVFAGRWSLADLHAKTAQILFTKTGLLEQADPANPAAYGLRLAAMEEIREAIARNPCELAYRVQHMNELGPLINANKAAQGRLALLGEAKESGKAAIGCHPTEVNAHYVAGIAAWMHVQLGMEAELAEAERELEKAIELDPMFLPLLEQRLLIAQRRGGPSVAEWARRVAEAKQRAGT